MRIKLVLLILALLGTAHLAASPIATRVFNEAAGRCLTPSLRAEKVSLDLINSQTSLRNLRLDSWNPGDPPVAEVRDTIVHWGFLAFLSKQCVLDEISVSGANCVIMLGETGENPWEQIRFSLPGSGAPRQPLLPALMQASWVTETLSKLRGQASKASTWERESPALASPGAPYLVEKHGSSFVVRYPAAGPSLILRDVYLADFSLRVEDKDEDTPALPALRNFTVRASNVAALVFPDKKPFEFTAQGSLEGQDASYIKAEGSLNRTAEGLSGTCDFAFEGLDIAKLWPWINPKWLPEEYAQFQVLEGVMDLKSRLRITENRWYVQNSLTLKKLKVRVDSGGPYRRIQGASPELVVNAINTLGETKMQFATLKQWQAAFKESVMKGIRNLIRNSIRDAISGVFTRA